MKKCAASSLILNEVKDLLKNRSGFSLVELLVVLAIMATLIFLGLPTFGRFYSFIQLWGDGRKITSDLRGYQQKSISDHYNYVFTFLNDKNYKIDKYDGIIWVEEVKNVEMDKEVTIQSAPSSITFYPLGNADAGATIIIRNINGESSTITVASATGHVSIQ